MWTRLDADAVALFLSIHHHHQEASQALTSSIRGAMASTSGSSSQDARRTTSLLSTPPSLLSQFSSPLPTRSYSRQYAALYDFRLRKLRRGRLLQKAKERWEGGGSAAAGGVAKGKEEKKTAAGIKHTARILDVKKGQVTYVSGIVYVEMRLKPDVLADLSREVSGRALPRRRYPSS